MNPIFFANQLEFRKWLDEHHDKEKEIIVGYYKISSGKPSMSWSESVDQALCYGWIDGIRRSIDKERYSIRFTPRSSKSVWSDVNIKKVETLTEQGLMLPAGLEIFNRRIENKSRVYSYENKPEELPEKFRIQFKANDAAWEYFRSQAASYQKTMYYWVMSAKQESTQLSRLEKLISASEKNTRIY